MRYTNRRPYFFFFHRYPVPDTSRYLPVPYGTNTRIQVSFDPNLGVFPANVGTPRSEDPKLIIPIINFELVQPICPWYINVTDRRMEGLTMAVPR